MGQSSLALYDVLERCRPVCVRFLLLLYGCPFFRRRQSYSPLCLFPGLIKSPYHPPETPRKNKTSQGPAVTEVVSRCRVRLVDLSRNHAPDVGQSEQDTDTSCSLPIGRTVTREPCSVFVNKVSNLSLMTICSHGASRHEGRLTCYHQYTKSKQLRSNRSQSTEHRLRQAQGRWHSLLFQTGHRLQEARIESGTCR